LQNSDSGGVVIIDSSSNDVTITIPSDTNESFADGTVIWLYRDGANFAILRGESGVTLNPNEGYIQSDKTEIYIRKQAANEWVVGDLGGYQSFITATGGTVSDITVGGVDYRVHEFTTVGTSTFEVEFGGEVEYLVVGGGGGGGSGTAGGGGAGGYRSSVSGELSGGNSQAESPLQAQAKTYNITVGAGGLGGLPDTREPSNGQNSSIDNEIISLGGGAGGDGDIDKSRPPGQTGGSGGGGWQYSGSSRTFGAGTAGQGFDGGNFGGTEGGGGGGGAGQAGQDNGAGDGGDGLESSIDGTPTYRAGGGGGGASSSGGAGGLGGGASSTGGSNNQPSGAPNTGGGGAGGWTYSSGDGGDGGSGIVIIRYRI